MPGSIAILSTGQLDPSLIRIAGKKDIDLECIPFIKTNSIESAQMRQEILATLSKKATVVFTSTNAVEAVASCLGGYKPEWSIYCIDGATSKLAAKYFGEKLIKGKADDAAGLARLIEKEPGNREIIFFCGNKRRDELPQKIRRNGKSLKEIIVYETSATPGKITKEYRGILFFSPSAVESFFSINQVGNKTILFAIGNTTAERIREFSNNAIITCSEPEKEAVVKAMISYFTVPIR
ncbi:MAG: uroporphyrinogen-III synthase [Chitinophagales bacterium]